MQAIPRKKLRLHFAPPQFCFAQFAKKETPIREFRPLRRETLRSKFPAALPPRVVGIPQYPDPCRLLNWRPKTLPKLTNAVSFVCCLSLFSKKAPSRILCIPCDVPRPAGTDANASVLARHSAVWTVIFLMNGNGARIRSGTELLKLRTAAFLQNMLQHCPIITISIGGIVRCQHPTE